MKIQRSRILAISAIVVLIAAFACKQKESNKTVILAHINGYEGQQALLKSTSPYQMAADTAFFNPESYLLYSLSLATPEYYTVAVGKTKMILYARPGDSVIFSANATNILPSVQFRGSAPIYNDYLIRFNKISADYQSKLMRNFANPESVVVHQIDSLRALHADELAALQKGNSNIDPYFLRIEKARILYEWAILHRIYPDYYNYIHRGADFKTSPEYDTYLAEVNLNDETLINLPLYLSFLDTYMRSYYNQYFTDSLESKYSSFAEYQLHEVDKKFTNKTIKALMAYNVVKQQIMYDGVKDMDSYWTTFKKLCNNKILRNNIDKRLAAWDDLKKGKPAKNFTFVSIDGSPVSLSDFKGKWVYIDIWATWCNPCMAEVPYLKKLEEEFQGKNIAFISISVDQTQNPWKKVVAQRQMKGVQLWAGQNEIIKNFYKVSGIPRFMIIDPQGNIYQASADRPSQGIAKLLAKLVK